MKISLLHLDTGVALMSTLGDDHQSKIQIASRQRQDSSPVLKLTGLVYFLCT